MIETIAGWLAEYTGSDTLWWAAIVLQFFAVEFTALFNKNRGDTWSEVLRFIFGFSKRSQAQGWGMRGRRLSFWGLAIWFVGHIAFGW